MDLIKDWRIIFLLCSERSGSNFTTKLMNNHSQICGPSTKHIINPLARNSFRYQPFNEKNWTFLLKDLLNLFNVTFSIWKIDLTLNELKENIETGDLKQLIFYIFNKEAQSHGKSHVFIKEIGFYEFYPFVKHYFPNANFLFQIRDPRDMALSWRKSKIHRGGVVQAAKRWKIDQQQFLKIQQLEQANSNIATFKYEELVSDPKSKLSIALDMINLDFESNMLKMDADELTKKNSEQLSSWKNISGPILRDNFNKYRLELNNSEIEIIEAICYFEMVQLGYKPEHSWESLSKISNDRIESFHQNELKQLDYGPSSGVRENMLAKQRFYQHVK